MAAKQNPAIALIKKPAVMAIIIIAIAIFIIWGSQKSDQQNNAMNDAPEAAEQAANADSDSSAASAGAMNLKPQAPGQDTPRIVAKMNQPQSGSGGNVAAPGLDRLLKGLEEKVAADPSNVNNRLLLAQTYNELGMQDKALKEMRELHKQNPDHGRINLILGSILSRSNDQEKVKESLALLDKASGDKTIQQYLVNLYKGDALIRMQDHDGALKHWKMALEKMPPSDNRRAMLEQRIAELSTREAKPAENAENKGKSS